MPGPATLFYRRCLGGAGVLTLALWGGGFSTAGERKPTDGDSAKSPQACTCADGRQFALGASVFGKNSSRVVITGFSPGLPTAAIAGILPPCTDLIVVGQVVRLAAAEDARPFLRRENRKQGTLVSVCETKIRFVKANKSYDFFADDGSALTLSDEDKATSPPPGDIDDDTGSTDADESGTRLNQDLTGRDLLRLMPAIQPAGDPGASPFNGEDLKEGAYVIVRKRVKAQSANGDGQDIALARVESSQQNEVNVPAGTLGKIKKSGGFRSEPLWIADIYPDSVPLPFWRSLMAGPKGFERHAVPPRQVVLASSQIVEINHFFDEYGVEWTRFGDDMSDPRERQDDGTMQLPEIYSPPRIPIDENISIAQKARVFDTIRGAAMGLAFNWKQSIAPVGPGTLVIEERNPRRMGKKAVPDLLRRQCFIDPGMFALASAGVPPAALVVSDVDVRVFQPQDSAQEPRDYYAIDLELKLASKPGGSKGTIVCRFPSAPINLGLLDMAEQILASRFNIQVRKAN